MYTKLAFALHIISLLCTTATIALSQFDNKSACFAQYLSFTLQSAVCVGFVQATHGYILLCSLLGISILLQSLSTICLLYGYWYLSLTSCINSIIACGLLWINGERKEGYQQWVVDVEQDSEDEDEGSDFDIYNRKVRRQLLKSKSFT